MISTSPATIDLAPLDAVIADIARGKPVLVLDDAAARTRPT